MIKTAGKAFNFGNVGQIPMFVSSSAHYASFQSPYYIPMPLNRDMHFSVCNESSIVNS